MTDEPKNEAAIDLAGELAEMDDDYQEAEVSDTPGGDAVPNGNYQVRIIKAELARTKDRQVPILKWQLRVLAGPMAKRVIFRHNLIERDRKDSVKWLKQDLHTAGLDLASLAELPDRINDLFGVCLEVKVSTKKSGDQTYTNVFFQRKIVVADGAEGDAGDGFNFGANATGAGGATAGASHVPPGDSKLDEVF